MLSALLRYEGLKEVFISIRTCTYIVSLVFLEIVVILGVKIVYDFLSCLILINTQREVAHALLNFLIAILIKDFD